MKGLISSCVAGLALAAGGVAWAALPDAVLPAAPVPAPEWPEAFDAFTPPVTTDLAVTQAPMIAEWTRTAAAGDTLALTGARLSAYADARAGRDARFHVFGQSGAQALLAPAAIQRLSGDRAALTLPATLPKGALFLLWPENAHGAGPPVALNRAEAWWIGPHTATRGARVSLFGRNLARVLGVTTQAWIFVGGQWAGVTRANPYKVDFLVPAGLSNGTHQVWAHNGSGRAYGWSEPLALTIEDGVAWTGPVVNVRSFGALGDGVADDGAAISAALQAAYQSTLATLYFPTGTYLTSRGWSPPPNMRWLGDGRDRSIIACHPAYGTNGWNLPLLFSDGNCTNAEFVGLTLDANGNLNTYLDTLVRIRFGGNLRFRDMLWQAKGAGTADLHASARVWLEGVDLIGGGNFLGTASQVFIERCRFYGTDGAGALLTSWGGQQISVTQCTAQDLAPNLDTPDTWCAGRFYVTQGHWGGQSCVYFGENTTIDMTCHPDFADQNVGEQILFELGTGYFTGRPLSATSNSVRFASLPMEPSALHRLVVTSGTGVGQYRRVVACDVTNAIVTVAEPWRVAPDSNSFVAVVLTVDRAVLYANAFDAKPRAWQSASHIASSGVQTYCGGLDFIVDGNTFHEIRTPLALWANLTPAENVPQYFGFYANNRVESARWGLSIFAGHPAAGADFLGNVIRGNSFSNVLQYAIGIVAGTSGGNPAAWVDLNVVERNAAEAGGAGVEHDAHAGAVSNGVYVGNALPGYRFGGERPVLHANAPAALDALPGPQLEVPVRVAELSAPAGGVAAGALRVWNSGTPSLTWSATTGEAWLQLTTPAGIVADERSTGVLGFTADPSGLPAGTNAAVVTIAANGWTQQVTVVLGAAPFSYAAWKAGYGLAGAGDSFDDDADGVPLLLEYALALDPTAADVLGLPALGDDLVYTFSRARPELVYEVQQSTNLVDWLPLAVNPGVVGADVPVPIPATPGDTLGFVRLQVTRE